MGSLRVELTVVGRPRADALGELRAAGVRPSATVLETHVRDAAALYGVLQRLAALGIELRTLRTSASGDTADVEIVVRGPVGPLLEAMLADVAHTRDVATSELQVEDVDVVAVLELLERLVAPPAPGDAAGRHAQDGGGLAAGHHMPPRHHEPHREGHMAPEIEELGPIDYIVVEFPENRLDGTAFPLLVDLVERGIIRILDLRFVTKDADDRVQGVAIADLDVTGDFDLRIFEGASSDLLGQDDLEEAAAALTPGSAAGILVYENAWAAPFATALRHGGGQLVASGRIPVQAIIAALDATDATDATDAA